MRLNANASTAAGSAPSNARVSGNVTTRRRITATKHEANSGRYFQHNLRRGHCRRGGERVRGGARRGDARLACAAARQERHLGGGGTGAGAGHLRGGGGRLT